MKHDASHCSGESSDQSISPEVIEVVRKEEKPSRSLRERELIEELSEEGGVGVGVVSSVKGKKAARKR